MQMVWNQQEKTFVSQGQIGVAICGKREVNRCVPGIIEIQKRSSNRGGGNNKTEIKMFFEIGSEWFYFEYINSTLRALSSVKAFNAYIDNTPAKKRMLDADSRNNLSTYRYTKGSLANKRKFVERYAAPEEK